MMNAAFGSDGSSRSFEAMLASHAQLQEPHFAFVRSRLGTIETHSPERPIFGRDDEPGRAVLVLSGWAGAVCSLEDGRRQIVSLFLPGDLISAGLDARNGLEAVALTGVRTLEAGDLVRALTAGQTSATEPLAQAWAAIREDADARLVHQIIRLGRMSAYERTLDLFLELEDRHERAGLSDERGIGMPLTQEVLADHLGLSVVHMNRTMQQLRRDKMIVSRSGRLRVLHAARATHELKPPAAR